MKSEVFWQTLRSQATERWHINRFESGLGKIDCRANLGAASLLLNTMDATQEQVEHSVAEISGQWLSWEDGSPCAHPSQAEGMPLLKLDIR